MNWNRFQREFKRAARKLDLTGEQYDAYVTACLDYAKCLHTKNLPVIFDGIHLCNLVGYRPEFVYAAANDSSRFYRQFTVKKKSGGERTISEPLPSLKEIQRWILDRILNNVRPSKFAKGFRRNYSIRDNAKFHIGQKYVISLDLVDFFPSINYERVYSTFAQQGYSKAVATLLSHLCTLEDQLPQGAPTSPALSNLIATRLDRRIGAFAIKNGYRYTRYADDITLSGLSDSRALGPALDLIAVVARDEGFVINSAKTRIMRQGQRQEVTGVVVNSKLAAPRDMRRSLRQVNYYVEKFGLASHMEHSHVTKRAYLQHVLGKANFILFINSSDTDAIRTRELLGFTKTSKFKD